MWSQNQDRAREGWDRPKQTLVRQGALCILYMCWVARFSVCQVLMVTHFELR